MHAYQSSNSNGSNDGDWNDDLRTQTHTFALANLREKKNERTKQINRKDAQTEDTKRKQQNYKLTNHSLSCLFYFIMEQALGATLFFGLFSFRRLLLELPAIVMWNHGLHIMWYYV